MLSTFVHYEGPPPHMHIRRSRLTPTIESTFLSFSHCRLMRHSWLEKLEIRSVTHAFWIWRTLNEVCSSFTLESKHLIRYAYDDEGSRRNQVNVMEWKKSILPISWWHSRGEPHYERLSRGDSLGFGSTLFKSISGSQGKAAWGAYIRFMSLFLSQDKDKKPQEECVETVSKSVGISEAG